VAQHVSSASSPIIRSSTTAVAASGFYRWNVLIAVLLSGRPRPTAEADTAVVELLMMGVRTPEKC